MTDQALPSPATGVAAPGGKRDASTIALVAGVIGLAVALIGLGVGWVDGNNRFIKSWLFGLSFWTATGVGLLMLTMIWYVFDAGWSTILRRQVENALSAFPYLAVLFLPLVVISLFHENPGIIWKWWNPEFVLPDSGVTVKDDALFIAKSGYLDPGFFLVRATLYFGVFCGLSYLLRKWSLQMDANPDPKLYIRCRALSAAGIFLTAFCATFAAFDWLMSLSYHWFSTMYGVWFFAVSMRLALAATIILCYFLAKEGHLRGLYKPAHEYYMGCLCLAFTIFWAYISFSQYFLIYNTNIPEETFWYVMRFLDASWSANSWFYIAWTLVIGFFIVPFFYLLWYVNKFGQRLLFIAGWIAFFALFDFWFNIMPAHKPAEVTEKTPLGYKVNEFLDVGMVFDLAALVGIGGICVWAMLKSMKKTEPIPIHDPRIEESVNAQL